MGSVGSTVSALTGNILPSVGGFGGVAQGIGGTMSDIMGQSQVANVTGNIGMAQLQQQQADRQQALGLAAPTDRELQALQQQMAVNQQQIQQGQALLSAADPALIEAGHQALALMQGKSAEALAPIQNQRDQQRAQLEQQLQQQLGPGYKTSSAGIQALNNFDQQTANLMTQAQQSTLQNFLGVSQGAVGLGGGLQQQGSAGMMSNLAGQQHQQGMQINAITGNPINPGLQYTGQLAQSQSNAQNMQQLLGFMQGKGAQQGFGGGNAPGMTSAGIGADQGVSTMSSTGAGMAPYTVA